MLLSLGQMWSADMPETKERVSSTRHMVFIQAARKVHNPNVYTVSESRHGTLISMSKGNRGLNHADSLMSMSIMIAFSNACVQSWDFIELCSMASNDL